MFVGTYQLAITISTCLEDTKKMPVKPGSPLASGYISEKIAYKCNFLITYCPPFENLALPITIVFLAIRNLFSVGTSL
jgi:hypothetical protein